jgi:glycosyltransferase involved in cell wall biosynthesis
MSKYKPFFTIIIPNYKTEHFLEETLFSVKNQLFKDFESIVVNDGSPGVDVDKIKNNENSLYKNKFIPKSPNKTQYNEIFNYVCGGDKRFKILDKENGGQGSARNLALDNANGEFVLFLDADDYYLPEHLEKLHIELAKNIDTHKNAIYYFKNYQEFQVIGNKEVLSNKQSTEQRSKNNVSLNTNLVFNQIGSTFCVINFEIFKNVRFRPLCKTMEDVDIVNRMFLEFQKNNRRLKAIQIDISTSVMHRRHENSITTIDSQNGSPEQSKDMINQYKDFLQNQPLNLIQKLLCYLGILRFNINPNKTVIHKYTRKIFTLVAKIISGWWL